ncbi:Mur ligase [Phycomyces nitens]|nr:Mur ligase [Phycomyces nitens]
MSNFKTAIDRLNSLQTNASLLEKLRKAGPRANEQSLPEMREYLKRIGYEASTKGKGSTSAITQSILSNYPDQKPIKTGLFTSPHLISVRERIRINGEPLSEELFAKYSNEVWDRLENTKEEALAKAGLSDKDLKASLRDQRQHPDKPIYFRYLTLVAFHAFIQEKVDVAILEVGVGGEYDSTNMVEKPVVCGITALGLDHVGVLGNTIDKIAWHKAGIIKHRVPAVAFEQLPEAMKVVEERAKEKEAPLQILHARDIDVLKDVEIGLAGIHQKYNALTAIALCKIWLKHCRQVELTEAVPAGFRKGLANVKWPGRGQQLSSTDTKCASQIPKSKEVTWYLDGAHTLESLQVCADWFRQVAKDKKDIEDVSRILVFNTSNGRDGPNLLQVISKIQPFVGFDHVIFTTNMTYREGDSADNTNYTVSMADVLSMQSLLAESWVKQVPSFSPENVHVVGSLEEATEWIVDHTKSTEAKKVQILATGSLIMVGNTLTVLGIAPQ